MKDHEKQCVESYLPLDLVGDILSRLPVKALIRFRCVCKPWRFLIDDAKFAKEQHIRASPALICPNVIQHGLIAFYDFDRPEYDIRERMPKLEFKELVGCRRLSNSVNGLICGYKYSRVDGQKYCLLNPSTRTLVQLPSPDLSHKVWGVSLGLGFDVSTGNYKLVLLSLTRKSRVYSCFVLTVGYDNKWRYVGDIPSSLRLWRPVFAEGVINWLSELHENEEKVMLAFHMKDEKFHVIPTPKSMLLTRETFLSNCDGHLWLNECSQECISIWKLKDYRSQIWTREYQIDFPSGFSIAFHIPGLLAIKDDKLVLNCTCLSSESQLGNVYDNVRKSFNSLFTSSYSLALPLALYTESLVCPRNLLGLKEVF